MNADYKDFIKIVKSLLPGFSKIFMFFLFLVLIHELIKFIPPYLLKLIVDGLIEGIAFEYLMMFVAGVFIVMFLMTFIEVFFLVKVGSISARQQKQVLEASFSKLLNLPLSWHEKQNTGTLVSKVTKAAQYIQQLIWFVNHDILPSIIQLFLTGIVLVWIDWRLGIIYLVFAPIILYIINRQFRNVQPYREEYHRSYENSTKIFAQGLYNIKTVKDYVQERREENEQTKYLNNYVDSVEKRSSNEFWSISFRDNITNFVRVLTTALAVYLVYSGDMTPGDLVFVFTIVEKAFINLHRFGRIYTFMGDTYSALERTYKIQNTPNYLIDEGRKTPNKADIKFEDIYFSYDDEEDVLKNINVDIPENKTTAIVGPSGSGKSTFVNLIMRHYDPTSGSIKMGGIDLRDIPLNKLRRNVAFVSQHTEIFDRNAFENISYSNPKASYEEVVDAAKRANAHHFISEFPNGYDTILGERGVRLSGGQQQRISIARALLSRAPVIIFDEATSSLDTESEKEIQDAIASIKDKTVIIIAHRLSTIENSDKIIVIKDGEILEEGSHSELLNKKSSLYKNMRELQNMGEVRK